MSHMKKTRIAALLLALALCLSLLPVAALAEEGESFTITFDANGGKFSDGPFTVKFDLNCRTPKKDELPKDQTIVKGNAVSLPNGKTPTTFGPVDPCTRGQIVTFLYWACVK